MRMDAAYARLLGTNGVIDPNHVNIVLPTNSDLFDSPNAARFVEDAKKSNETTPLIHMRYFAEQTLGSEMMNGFFIQVVLDNIYILISNAQLKIFSVADDTVLHSSGFTPVTLYNQSSGANTISRQLVAISRDHMRWLRPPTATLTSLTWNYLCMIVTAPVEQLELALGRRGLHSVPKSRSAVRTWHKTSAARRAVLHAAQIFNILTNGAYLPPSSVDKTLLRVEAMVFTAALVLGLYFLMEETSMPPSTGADNPIPASGLELLQDIDWAIVDDAGLTGPRPDGAMDLDSVEPTFSRQCVAIQAKKFINSGLMLLSFNQSSQTQGTRMARRVLQEYAYLLDQLGGYRSPMSVSGIANLVRSICDVLET
jgi:hypothetical protein